MPGVLTCRVKRAQRPYRLRRGRTLTAWGPFWPSVDLELDRLTFRERSHAGGESGDVCEDVRAAVGLLDEAVALACVEPLDCSFGHYLLLVSRASPRRTTTKALFWQKLPSAPPRDSGLLVSLAAAEDKPHNPPSRRHGVGGGALCGRI